MKPKPRRWFAPLVLAACACTGLACGGDDRPPTDPDGSESHVTTVTVSPDSVKLTEDGATQDFDATAKDQSGNTMSGVSFSWSVSDEAVASIDGDGTVTAKAEGTVTVRAAASGVTGSATLAVDDLAAATILTPEPNTAVTEGDTVMLTGTATDQAGDTISGSDLVWRSDIQGQLGTGATLQPTALTASTHWIYLNAHGEETTYRDSVTLLVREHPDSVDRKLTEKDTAAGFVVGRVSIRYKEREVSNNVLARVNREYGLQSQRKVPDLPIYIGTKKTSSTEATRQLAQSLNADDRIKSASVDLLVGPTAEDVEVPPDQRQHELTLTARLWKRLKGRGVEVAGQRPSGSRVRVAVIEFGFDLKHTEFSPTDRVQDAGAVQRLFDDTLTRGNSTVQDSDAHHGTAVASVALGANSEPVEDGLAGVAPGAALVPVDPGGLIQLPFTTWVRVAKALVYAADEADASVINMSLGLTRLGREISASRPQSFLEATGLAHALMTARDAGAVVVYSAGNCGADYDKLDALGRGVSGVSEDNLVVGGTNFDGDDTFRGQGDDFFGIDVFGECPSDIVQSQNGAVDVVAPGVGLRAAKSGSQRQDTSFSGTSAAAPVVSGLVAAYISDGHSPSEASQLVRERTLDLASDGSGLGTDDKDRKTGHGRVISGLRIDSIHPFSLPRSQSVRSEIAGSNFGKNATVLVNDRQVEPTQVDMDGLAVHFRAERVERWVDVRVEHGSGLTSNSVRKPVFSRAYFTGQQLEEATADQSVTAQPRRLPTRPPSGPPASRSMVSRDQDWPNVSNAEVMGLFAGDDRLTRLTNNAVRDGLDDLSHNGWVLFETRRDGNFELYRMRMDGSQVQNLTQHPAFDVGQQGSAISPNGQAFVFPSARNDEWHLYTGSVSAPGQANQLTDFESRFAGNPDWAHRSATIVFSAGTDDIPHDLYTIKSDGSGRRKLVESSAVDWYPEWSPDDSQVVFIRSDPQSESGYPSSAEIMLLDVSSGNVRQLTDNDVPDLWPTWSPGGNEIAFVSKRSGRIEVYTMDWDGGRVQRVTHNNIAESVLRYGRPE